MNNYVASENNMQQIINKLNTTMSKDGFPIRYTKRYTTVVSATDAYNVDISGCGMIIIQTADPLGTVVFDNNTFSLDSGVITYGAWLTLEFEHNLKISGQTGELTYIAFLV